VGCHGALFHRQHALNRKSGPPHDFRREFHARFEIPKTLAQLLKCIGVSCKGTRCNCNSHSDEMEALVRREFLERIQHSASVITMNSSASDEAHHWMMAVVDPMKSDIAKTSGVHSGCEATNALGCSTRALTNRRRET